MAGLFDLKGHLVFYRLYHFNHTNVAIHLACIPVILLLAITLLQRYEVVGPAHPYVTLGGLVAWSYGIYYVLLDWKCGIPLMAVLVTFYNFIRQYYIGQDAAGQSHTIQVAAIAHVVLWLAQFYGHGVHEKRAPALLDNLLQALVLAPFFVAFEIAFALGLRKDLKKQMDNETGKRIAEFKLRKKAQ